MLYALVCVLHPILIDLFRYYSCLSQTVLPNINTQYYSVMWRCCMSFQLSWGKGVVITLI